MWTLDLFLIDVVVVGPGQGDGSMMKALGPLAWALDGAPPSTGCGLGLAEAV